MEAQAWAGCPAGLGPQGSRQWGATAPQRMQKGPPFLLSPIFYHRRAVAPGMARGAPEGWAGGPLRRQPELCSTTADSGEAWAGLGRAVGMGPACPRVEGRLGPVRVGSAATELGPGGPLHANTVHWALTRTPQSSPVHPSLLA